MRRADRLFQLVQLLRRRRVTTAAWLAEQLGVSDRTIYRDVQDLICAGVPIEGEAGVGYALPTNFDLPPLMFDREEIAALALGARIVQSWGDDRLARAAGGALAKVQAVVPPALKRRIDAEPLYAPSEHVSAEMRHLLAPVRTALEGQRVMWLSYVSREGAPSERRVHPLGLFFWGNCWSLIAWCELRQGFRNFRVDRIDKLELLDERFEPQPGRTLEDFIAAGESLGRVNTGRRSGDA
jgi:predicted DNA-binding transcriptional regulator YafY